MSHDRLLPEHVVADRLGLSRRTLQQWRREGKGPVWVRVGTRAIRYRESAVQRFIEVREVAS